MIGLLYNPEEYVSIADVTNHLRIDIANGEDTTYITTLITAAVTTVSNDIGRELYPPNEVFDASSHPNAIPFANALKVASLLLIGTWYENRESVITGISAQELPMAYKMLIRPYRILQSGLL